MQSFDQANWLRLPARHRIGTLVCSLVCCYAMGVCAEEVLVESGAGQWRYHDAPTAQSEQWSSDHWTAIDFDDSNWSEGQAILGYGDNDVRTELSFGSHPQRKESSALFRRRFRVARLNPLRLLRGRVCCDDGAIVFVNGREVYRCNMPLGTVTSTTRAVRAIGPERDAERRYHQFSVEKESLVEGENVVAVSVHQANSTSSDLAMDLELTALTTDEEVAAFQDELKRQAELQGPAAAPNQQMAPVVRFGISSD